MYIEQNRLQYGPFLALTAQKRRLLAPEAAFVFKPEAAKLAGVRQLQN